MGKITCFCIELVSTFKFTSMLVYFKIIISQPFCILPYLARTGILIFAVLD